MKSSAPNILSSLILSSLLLVPTAASAKRKTKAVPTPVASAEEAPPPAPPDAQPEAAPAPPPATPATGAPAVSASGEPANADVRKRIGIGYKIGNGWGFVGGDVILNVVDHLTLDVQVNRLSFDVGQDQSATGWAYGAEAQLFLYAGQVWSPYVGVGLSRGSLSLRDVSASATAFVANVGYEFRWRFGLGILLGAGVGVIGNVHAMSPQATIDVSGGTAFNLEAGLRYMLF